MFSYRKYPSTSHSRHFRLFPIFWRCFLHYMELELECSNLTRPRGIQHTIANWCSKRIFRMCSICDEPRPCKAGAQVNSETQRFIFLSLWWILQHIIVFYRFHIMKTLYTNHSFFFHHYHQWMVYFQN